LPQLNGERRLDLNKFAEEIRMALAKRNWPQARLAEALDLSPAIVNRACQGNRSMSVEAYYRLRSWLDGGDEDWTAQSE
jgi:transcriptional regulator with XRE-family HTH domain